MTKRFVLLSYNSHAHDCVATARLMLFNKLYNDNDNCHWLTKVAQRHDFVNVSVAYKGCTRGYSNCVRFYVNTINEYCCFISCFLYIIIRFRARKRIRFMRQARAKHEMNTLCILIPDVTNIVAAYT